MATSSDSAQRWRARLLRARSLSEIDLATIGDEQPLIPVTIGRHRGDNRFGDWEPDGKQRRHKRRRERDKPRWDD